MKDTLWDMLITMPTESGGREKDRVWPLVECPRGCPVKATQRDLRRYRSLRSGLARLARQNSGADGTDRRHSSESTTWFSDDQADRLVKPETDGDVDQLVEPISWACLAYNGYMWWASAGEQVRSEEQEESARDASLLADFGLTPQTAARHGPVAEAMTDSMASLAGGGGGDCQGDGEAGVELAIITYFHRLTTQMLSGLMDAVEGTDSGAYADEATDADERQALLGRSATGRRRGGGGGTDVGGDDEGSQKAVVIDSHCIEGMGLDVWSGSDASFVRELAKTYLDVEARVEGGKGVEVCGVRVC